LAKDLEGKIRTDSICNEIVHQLHGKVSERLIRRCLDEKYKETHRVKNARKQKPDENTKDLAATVPLEQEKSKQQIASIQDGKTVIMNDRSSDIEASPIPSNGVNELHDQSKRNGTGTNDNDEGRTTDADTKEESLTGEIEPVNMQSRELMDRKANFVSHVPMSFDNLRKDMDILSQQTKRAGNIFFKVSVNLRTHTTEIEFCGITEEKNRMMTSTGKGILKEAN